MIYLLKNEITGEEVMLPEVKAYSIGRQKLGGNKDDIVLANDQSISRNHAKITIKENGVVTIKDCKSRYHTLHNNKKLEPEQEVELKKGDAIQFGILKNRFRFETYSCIVTVSGLSSLKKLEVKNNVNYCGGRFVEKWCSNCTHLTVDKITLTVKVLQALVDEKPIVTTDYWNAYRENFDNNQPPPDITKYNRPQVAEQLLSSNFQCQPNPMRKTLFKDKVFVFFKNSLKNQMEDIIQSCGGTCISYQDESTAPTEICASPDKFIVMKHEEESESYKILIQNLVSGGRRAIALNEIALAVINCSCATHCNPKFDKANHVFARATCIMDTQQVLVQETQSEVIVEKVESHPADVIPATLEEEWDHGINPTVTEADTSKTSGVKRAHGDNNAVEVFKKARFKPKPKEKEPKSLVSDSSEQSQVAATTSSNKAISQVEQIESQKRKADEELTRDAKKKSNPFSTFKIGSKTKSSQQNNKDSASQNVPNSTSTNTTSVNTSLNTSRSKPDITQSVPSENEKKEVRLKSPKIEPSFDNSRSFGTSLWNDTWISRKSFIKSEVSKIEDPEIQRVSEKFKDCVKIEFLLEINFAERSVLKNVSNNLTNGFGNFKKFIKVPPRRRSIHIVNKEQLGKVPVGNVAGIHLDDFNYIDEDEKDTKIVKGKKKFIL